MKNFLRQIPKPCAPENCCPKLLGPSPVFSIFKDICIAFGYALQSARTDHGVGGQARRLLAMASSSPVPTGPRDLLGYFLACWGVAPLHRRGLGQTAGWLRQMAFFPMF